MKKVLLLCICLSLVTACVGNTTYQSIPAITPTYTIDHWLALLDRGPANIHDQAVNELVNQGVIVIPPILASDIKMELITEIIGRFGSSAVDPLITALKDQNPTVRYRAVTLLRFLGDQRAIEPLMSALSDNQYEVQHAAMIALGEFKDRRAVPLIIARLKAGDYSLDTVTVLGKLGDPAAVTPLLEVYKAGFLRSDSDTLVEALANIGPEGIDDVLPWLSDSDPLNRGIAAETLGKIGDPRAVGPLIPLLGEKENYVRALVMAALVEIGAPAVDAVIPVLEDKNPLARQDAAYTLGKIGDKRAVEPLISALSDEEPVSRIYVLSALGRIGDARAIPSLLEALKDPDQKIRMQAAGALGEIKDDRVTALMDQALQEKNIEIIAGARRYFIRLGKEGSEPLLIEAMNTYEYQEIIEDFLNCDNPQLLAAARHYVRDHNIVTISGPGESLQWGGK